MTADLSLAANQLYDNLVLFPTAARNITLGSATGINFFVGYIVTVHNLASAGGCNLNFAGIATVLPNTSKSFMCTGSNTFVQIW
jgi:hypothetical protein